MVKLERNKKDPRLTMISLNVEVQELKTELAKLEQR